MPIHFIPNDPSAQGALPVRQQAPRQDPPRHRARFSYTAAVPEALHPIGSPGFLFWQCREAALMALETWGTIARPLTRWQNSTQLLPLRHQGGSGLNALYDRRALSFLEWQTGTKKTSTAASTDAVAHEVGHALLDAIRPDLWGSVYTEVAAFHEAFADCLALLVCLFDRSSRQALVQGGSKLRSANFLEALAEDVADGIRREEGLQHPQSLPRRALNTLRWEIPINLPAMGPPALLTSEPHSFSRVFTGCLYDVLCGIFDLQPSQSQQGLMNAATIVGQLLVAGARSAPEGARFFQAVGRGMILADEAANQGRHHLAIRNGFANHGIALGSAAMMAPTSALAGPAPALGRPGSGVLLSPRSRRHLLERIGAQPGSRLRVAAIAVGARRVAQAVHRRAVDLGGADRQLAGVIAPAVETVLVGASAARAVILGNLPDAGGTADEVRHFVRTLLARQELGPGGPKQGAAPRAGIAGQWFPTHGVRMRGGQKMLARLRFACMAEDLLAVEQRPVREMRRTVKHHRG